MGLGYSVCTFSHCGIDMNTCKTCSFRQKDGYCSNEKLMENWGQSDEQKIDMLLYTHSEGGGFWVGPNFGCIHYSDK